MCDCGHAADWHSNHGKGDCEHDLDCLCEAFKEADPRQVENLIAEMRKRTRIVDDGWWCLARESELDSLAAAVSLLVTERDALAAKIANVNEVVFPALVAERNHLIDGLDTERKHAAAALHSELWEATQRAERAETQAAALRQALTQAVAEISLSPFQSKPWGWGICYRIEGWKELLAAEALAGGGRTPTGNVEWTFHSEPDLGVGAADVAEAGE